MTETATITTEDLLDLIKSLYGNREFISLHEPAFSDREKQYVLDCVESTFVSSVGEYVNRFEVSMGTYTGARCAVAVVNGTQGLFAALHAIGTRTGDLVITQALTFIATANAITYTGARPVFLDVDEDTLGMSPGALRDYLEKNARVVDGGCRHRITGAVIRAVVPMHTFGHACRVAEIKNICDEFQIDLVEDAAESLGTSIGDRHSGTFGRCGVFSFNGNKIITTGGGGMIVTDDEELAARIKHLTTTARVVDRYEFTHDEVGFNFRMPNLNAALGLAQMERLDEILQAQRDLAAVYERSLANAREFSFLKAPAHSNSNYWLNAVKFADRRGRDAFLELSNRRGVMTRPIWKPMHLLGIFGNEPDADLTTTEYLYDRVVNISSSIGPALSSHALNVIKS